MSERAPGILARAAIGASVVCYGASLALPALERGAHMSVRGWQCLLVGWSALLYLNPIWLANLAWITALVFLGTDRSRAAARFGLGGVVLSLLTIPHALCGRLIIPVVGVGEWGNEPWSLAPGFYAWSAAMWIPTLAGAFLCHQQELEAEGGPGRF